MTDWRPLIAQTARRSKCLLCDALSEWHPKGWWYRYVPQAGGKWHDAKVKTERMCPTCSKANGLTKPE